MLESSLLAPMREHYGSELAVPTETETATDAPSRPQSTTEKTEREQVPTEPSLAHRTGNPVRPARDKTSSKATVSIASTEQRG